MATTTKAPTESDTTPVPPPGDEAAKTPPPNTVPTTSAPVTTKTSGVNFSNIKLTSVNHTSKSPVRGTGGVRESFKNTQGEVTVDSVVLNAPFNQEITYVVYDANGSKDEYGDPIEFITGTTGTTIDNAGQPIIRINETVTAVADPSTDLGSMLVVIQLRDVNFTTQTTSVLVQNPNQRATTTRSPVKTTRPPVTTTAEDTDVTGTSTPGGTPAPLGPVTTTALPRQGEQMSQEAEDEMVDLFFEALDNTVTEDGTATEDTENLVDAVVDIASQRTTTTTRPPVVTQVEAPGVISTEPAVAVDRSPVVTQVEVPGVISAEPAVAVDRPIRAGERMSTETENEIADLFRKTVAGTVDEQVEELVETVVSAVVTTTTTSTTRRPVTTPRPVTPLGETEIDEVVTAQGPAHIQITDITVNNTAIEDNVDLTVEISNADHWNFSIDDGSTVRVASYDLEHQLCTDQSDPHSELIVKDFYDYWKELKYYDAPTNNQELLGDISLTSDESLIDLLNRQLDDKLFQEFDEDSDLLEEQLEERFGDLDSVGDRIMEDVERVQQRLEPFQQDLREWEERAMERGVEFEEFEIPNQSVDDDGNIVEEPPDIIRTIITPEDQIPQDLLDELAPIAEAAVEPILEMVEQAELMLEVMEEGVDLLNDFVEGGENLHENEKLKKDLAKQLLDDLSKGRITAKQLAKLLSRLPSVGTGGLIDQLLYRRGYIPAPEGWLMPHPNFIPGAIPGPGVGGPHLHFPNILSVVPPSNSICSHDAPCDSPLRTVTLTVEPGEHDVLVTAVNSNNQPVTTASSRFAVNGPSNEVSSQRQLIAALRNFSNVKLTDNFEITKTIEIPAGAKIIGVGNPIISTATTAFSIKESNVELNGFTITKSQTSIGPTGPGVIIDRPSRNSTQAPSNITIKNIVFNGLGTIGVSQTGPITILGFNKLDATPLSNKSLSILGATNQPIRDVNIENNTFNIPFNTAIEAWEVDNLRVYNNIIRNTFSHGIEVTNITNSNILSNRLNRIAGSGVLLQGSKSNNVQVENNNISTFGTSAAEGFKTGIGTLNGVNGIEILNNNITNGSNFWNAGISVKQGSSNVLIDSNLVDNTRDGIYVGDESDTVNTKRNTITNVQRYGIQTYRSWGLNILNNNITQSSEALKTFENLSKIQQRTIGVGCGILIGSCNGVTVFANVINGSYKEENGDSAILVSGQYPIGDIDQASVEYASYDSGALTDIYGSPGVQVTDSLVEIIVSGNAHAGEGRLFSSNGARIILPGIDPSNKGDAGGGDENEGNDVTVPGVATTKMPVIVTSTTPPVVRTTKPPDGIVTGPTTTTTTTTQRPKGTIIIVPPTGTNTDGAVDTFIDQNTDLTDKNEVVIVNTDPEDPSSGFTQTETGTTPYVDDNEVIISPDPQVPVTTTTTTTTIAPRRTADGRTAEQIARDNYISNYIELNDARAEVFNRYISGLISITELGQEGAILTNRYDVEGKKIEYENIRYTDGLWKENLSNWIDTRSISPCSKKISQELIKLMPQDFEDQDLYWAGNSVLDTSGISEAGTTHYDRNISYRENMKTVRKAAVLISPIHVLMADHWRYAPYENEQGEMIYPELTWETTDGEKITRTIVEAGVKVPGVDTRVLILNEPVPDKLAIYPLPAPSDNYNDLLTGSLVLIGNQQRKYTVGYVMAAVPTIQYNYIFNEGNDAVSPAISEGYIKLSFDAKLPFLNQWIPTKYSSFDDGDRPESYAELDGIVKGDSGSPNFILSPNGDPILISQHQLGGISPKMPFLGDSTVQEHIKNAMDSLSDKHNLPRYGLRTIDPCTGTKTSFPGIIDEDEEEEDDDDPIIPIVIIDPEDDVDDDDPIDPIILYTTTTTPEPGDSGKVVVYSTTPPPRGTTPKLPPPARAGCMDPSAVNWDPRATVDDGSCVFITDATSTTPPLTGGGMVGRQKPGCTNPNALNFDPTATFDDGSCIFPPVIVRGCTDPTALNFNPGATFDDGTCRWPIIFEPPTTQPPYIPATCRESPKVPLGETEPDGEGDTRFLGPEDISTNNIENRIDIEQEANEPVRKIFPAPINAMEAPFNSEVNFNTNITKKVPTPYGFTTISPNGGGVEPVDEEELTTDTTTICPPDNENCNTLQY